MKNLIREYGLSLTLILAFVVMPAVSVFSVNVYGIIPLILAALTLGTVIIRKEKLAFDKPLALWLGGILLLAAASSLWSATPAAVLEKTAKITLLWSCCYIIYSAVPLAAAPLQDRILRWSFYSFAAACSVMVFELAFNHPLLRLFKSMPDDEVILPSAVNHGAVILVLMFFALLFYHRDRKILDAAAFFAGLLLAAQLMMGQSETALGALFVGGGVYFSARLMPRFTHAALMVLIPACILAAPFIAQGLFDLLATKEWKVLAMRLEIWDAVARYSLQNPIYGYGVEAARYIRDFDLARIYYQRSWMQHPHNNILQVWLEFGAAGALLLSSFILFILRRLRRLPASYYPGGVAAFAAIFTAATPSYGLWQSWWTPAIFMIICLMRAGLPKAPAHQEPQ